MNLTLFTLIFTAMFLPRAAEAQSLSIDGGHSPDGKYDVQIVRTPHYNPDKDGSEHSFRVQSDKGHSVLTLAGNGYRRSGTAAEFCRACWDSSSQFVAITDQDSRHSTKLQIAAFPKTGLVRLELPDYAQDAFGRAGAIAIDRSCVTALKR